MLGRVFHIFWREYLSNVTRRSYLLFTFGFPLLLMTVPLLGGVALGVTIRAMLPQTDARPVGVVDDAQLLLPGIAPPDDPVRIIRFADLPTAELALNKQQVQAIYHIPPDYWQSGQVKLSYDSAPTAPIDGMFTRWVRQHLHARLPAETLTRLEQGPVITRQSVAGGRDFSAVNYVEPVLVYMIIYFVRLAGSFSASYMFDSIASESDDRTLEMMLATVPPFQFILGKLGGVLSVGLTQIGVWAAGIFALVILAGQLAGINLLTLLLRWEHLPLMIVVLGGAYLMDQIFAAALGLLRVSGGAGNMLFGTLNTVVGVSLIYAAYFVPRNPHTVLAVAASLFPLTAPLVLLIRVVVSEVPLWQIAASLLLLAATNLCGLYWLKRLLQANLLASRDSFSFRRWARGLFRSYV